MDICAKQLDLSPYVTCVRLANGRYNVKADCLYRNLNPMNIMHQKCLLDNNGKQLDESELEARLLHSIRIVLPETETRTEIHRLQWNVKQKIALNEIWILD